MSRPDRRPGDPRADRLCHWCLRRIRFAPVLGVWFHHWSGAEACGDDGILAEHFALPAFAPEHFTHDLADFRTARFPAT